MRKRRVREDGKGPELKCAVLVADGMADRPLDELGGRSPLEAARTPAMDILASRGMVGTVKTLDPGMPASSDVAMLCLLGYDPARYYTGRGPLEAASMGISLADDEVAYRCNLITVANGLLIDYSAGHISNEEAAILVSSLNKQLGDEGVRFNPGISYRHLAVIKRPELAHVRCDAPHDIMGEPIEKHFPQGEGAEFLENLMRRSAKILEEHEVNAVRRDLGENPANMIWLWGQGRMPTMPSFEERFGIRGAVISAVDVVKGIGRVLGLKVVDVPGATGYFDTDYSAKAQHGIRALAEAEFVLIHVEATDEAGHVGDARKKIKAIEDFDSKIVGPVVEYLETLKVYRVMVLPDHATPVAVRTHTREPVPFVIAGVGIGASNAERFSESQARKHPLYVARGHELMPFFLGKEDAVKLGGGNRR